MVVPQRIPAVAAVLVGLLSATGQTVMEGGCIGDCEPAGLLQTVHTTVDRETTDFNYGGWVVAFWGKCKKNCGRRKFRDFTCRSIVDGAQLPLTACKGSKPVVSKECNCKKEECDESPAEDCPEEVHERTFEGAQFEQLGCLPKSVTFTFPLQDKKGPQRDLSCAGWNESLPCHGGLPFYGWRQFPIEAEKCVNFCAAKGMDLAGLEGNHITNRCRCGASILSTSIWNGGLPMKGLSVDFSTLAHVPKQSKRCPIELYRYTGYYTPNGLPSFLWLDAAEKEDIAYIDAVKGKEGHHRAFWPGHPDGDFTIE